MTGVCVFSYRSIRLARGITRYNSAHESARRRTLHRHLRRFVWHARHPGPLRLRRWHGYFHGSGVALLPGGGAHGRLADRATSPAGRAARRWRSLIGMGALGYVGQSFCYLTATQYASAGLVALLLYLYPIFVAILSVIFLKEKLTRLKVIALALATCGVALTADPQGGSWMGIVLAIGAAAIYSVYIIVGTGVLKRVTAIQSSTVIFASAGAVYATLAIIKGPQLAAAAHPAGAPSPRSCWLPPSFRWSPSWPDCAASVPPTPRCCPRSNRSSPCCWPRVV